MSGPGHSKPPDSTNKTLPPPGPETVPVVLRTLPDVGKTGDAPATIAPPTEVGTAGVPPATQSAAPPTVVAASGDAHATQPPPTEAAAPPTEAAAADSKRPTPSAAIPGYEILSVLGRGGMGIVYKARQAGLNRIVALKMILSGQHAGETELARFRAEASAVAKLQHPNIVQVYEVGEHDGRPFFSMEFVEGGNLHTRIDGQPQPPRWSAEIAEKLALAMHVAHSQGIIHRDLKPANVLLAEDGATGQERDGVTGRRSDRASLVAGNSPRPPVSPSPRQSVPKIMDFGLAKRLDEETLTLSGAIMGTPQFMAPEQASGGTKHVGPLADVYALGAILYQMLTGRPPFKAETAMKVIEQVLSAEPVMPSRITQKIPRDLETICLKCLQKEPQKRYASAHELAADLRRYLNNEPIVARPVGALERARMWSKRHPARAGLVAVSVLAVAALVGGGIWYNARLNQKTIELVEALRKARENESLARESEERAQYAFQRERESRESMERARTETEKKTQAVKFLQQTIEFKKLTLGYTPKSTVIVLTRHFLTKKLPAQNEAAQKEAALELAESEYLSAAAPELQRELERIKALPVPQDPKAKKDRETEEQIYLDLLKSVKESLEASGTKK